MQRKNEAKHKHILGNHILGWHVHTYIHVYIYTCIYACIYACIYTVHVWASAHRQCKEMIK